jgi:hypothetical protein
MRKKKEENTVLQHVVTSKLTNTGMKNFIFITYSSDSVGLQNFTEIKGGHVNCCVDLIWDDPIGFSVLLDLIKPFH